MYSPHHTPNTSPKKPSPLSYATSSNPSSPRQSPFKRAQSPAIQQHSPATSAQSPSAPRARARTPSTTVRAGTSAAPAPSSLLSPSRSPTRDVFGGPSEYPISSPIDANAGGSVGVRDIPRTRERSPDVREVFGNDATVASVTKGEGASPAVSLKDAGHWSPSGGQGGGYSGIGGPKPSPGSGGRVRGVSGPRDPPCSPKAATGAIRSGSPVRAAGHAATQNGAGQESSARNSVAEQPRQNSSPRQSRPQSQAIAPATSSPRPALQSQPAKTTNNTAKLDLVAGGSGTDAMSKVHPARLREMHESFQVLDRDSDGLVDRSDVAEMLAQLGLPNDPSSLNAFLPTSHPPTHTNLPNYLSTLTSLLSPLSPTPELSAAFSAFDTDDSGQIDAAELRAALVQGYDGTRGLEGAEVDSVLGEFGGRRMFAGRRGMGGGVGGKTIGAGGGEVFRWREFVNAVSGSGGARGGDANAATGGDVAGDMDGNELGRVGRDGGIVA